MAAGLSNPPTPRDEGSGVGVNKKACGRSWEVEKKRLKIVGKSSLPGAGGRGWGRKSGNQGPGGKCAIRCSICSPTRLRGSRGRIWAAPDEKGWIFDHLGVFLVSKMAFLRSGTDPICFKFESDALKMKEF